MICILRMPSGTLLYLFGERHHKYTRDQLHDVRSYIARLQPNVLLVEVPHGAKKITDVEQARALAYDIYSSFPQARAIDNRKRIREAYEAVAKRDVNTVRKLSASICGTEFTRIPRGIMDTRVRTWWNNSLTRIRELTPTALQPCHESWGNQDTIRHLHAYLFALGTLRMDAHIASIVLEVDKPPHVEPFVICAGVGHIRQLITFFIQHSGCKPLWHDEQYNGYIRVPNKLRSKRLLLPHTYTPGDRVGTRR